MAEDDHADSTTHTETPTKSIAEGEPPILDLIEKPEDEPVPAPTRPAKPAEKRNVVVAAPLRNRPRVPVALLREWQGKLVQRIHSAAKAGKPLRGEVRIDGRLKVYPLLGADGDGLQIEINGNPMPVLWNWLKPRDQAVLVKSLASKDDLESLLMLSVFLKADGQDAPSRRALQAAEMLDVSAANKTRQALGLSGNSR
jgi:hypothetical protein